MTKTEKELLMLEQQDLIDAVDSAKFDLHDAEDALMKFHKEHPDIPYL